MISLDTNVMVYATGAQPLEKAQRPRDLITRGLRSANTVSLLQTLGEFSHVA